MLNLESAFHLIICSSDHMNLESHTIKPYYPADCNLYNRLPHIQTLPAHPIWCSLSITNNIKARTSWTQSALPENSRLFLKYQPYQVPRSAAPVPTHCTVRLASAALHESLAAIICRPEAQEFDQPHESCQVYER